MPIAGMENSRAGANNETIYIHAATFPAYCSKYRLTPHQEMGIPLKALEYHTGKQMLILNELSVHL